MAVSLIRASAISISPLALGLSVVPEMLALAERTPSTVTSGGKVTTLSIRSMGIVSRASLPDASSPPKDPEKIIREFSEVTASRSGRSTIKGKIVRISLR